MGKTKKSFWIGWGCALAAMLYMGYLAAGLLSMEGISFDNYTTYLQRLLRRPFANYYNGYTAYFLMGAALLWLLLMVYAWASTHNLRPGTEYGTAKWGDIKDINKRLASLCTCFFLCFPYKKPDANNRILSEHIRISYDGTKTLLNNNILGVGGAGSGKTAFLVTPNLLGDYGSNVYTDPKGSLVEEFGNYLQGQGRKVLSLNLCDMKQSCHYNPFRYIRKSSDISKLITNLIANTTPGESHPNEPFWEKAEKMYLTALFSYVWLECPRRESVARENGMLEEITLNKSFRTVLYLLDEAAVSDDSEEKSKLDIRMNQLAAINGERHPAVRSYRRCIRGAGDTVRSIIVSANARFDAFDNEELLDILDDDDIDIPSLGIGVNGDGETKTSLFCCTPDDDDTYDFIPGMLYTQLFQELYRQARLHGGILPIDVGFWFDEFANIKMPNAFDRILATCRSRHMYCVILLQSLAQIKTIYKESKWEGIVGNCDTVVYLGGNEPSGHKYVSEQLDKETIEKRSSGESRGMHGSSSKNYDVMGRELMTGGEVRKIKDKCVCFIRGEDPIIDRKWNYYRKKIRKKVKAMGKFEQDLSRTPESMSLLKPKSLEYYQQCEKEGEDVKVYKMDFQTFLCYDFTPPNPGMTQEEVLAAAWEAGIKEEFPVEKGIPKTDVDVIVAEKGKTAKEELVERLVSGDFDALQIRILKSALQSPLGVDRILKIADPKMESDKMQMILDLMLECG